MPPDTSARPLFARCLARSAAISERKGADEYRRRLLAGLAGRVIEVGAGTGINFRHYPRAVAEVLAVEPEPNLRAMAETAAHESPVHVRVVAGTAEALPAPDGSIDAGVSAGLLCSVLLDEPTVGLDPLLRRDLWRTFHRLADEGTALLVSSHVMDEAANCDELVLLREGDILARATPDELRERTHTDDLAEAFLRLIEREPPDGRPLAVPATGAARVAAEERRR